MNENDQSGSVISRYLPNKVLITVSRYNGFQVSVEAKRGDEWYYFGGGISDYQIDVVYGHADPELGESLKEMASVAGEEPARYAAGHRAFTKELFRYVR